MIATPPEPFAIRGDRPKQADQSAAEVGSTANSYEILAKLATGGMAEIFLARGVGAVGVARHVVLKRILGEHATDEKFVTMFLDEARLVAQLQHPNIAQVLDVGTLGDSYFFTMEYVHGETVRALLMQTKASGGEIPLAAVLSIIAGAAAGLHHAHERLAIDGTPLGIVHRDVTPSNVMVSFEGNVKVVDFGVALSAGNCDRESEVGTIKGKTTYLSPEQCSGLALDRRSDLFSLGIVMWEMLATDRLYRRASEYEAMAAIVNEDAPLISSVRPSCPKDVAAIVQKLLSRDRDQRFASAAEVIEAIEDAAVANHAKLSASTLARLLRETFGKRPEPWIELERRTRPVTVMAGVSKAQLAAVPALELLPERRKVARAPREASPSDLAIPLAPKAPIVPELRASRADSDGGIVAAADDSPTMRWNVVAHPVPPPPSIFDTAPSPAALGDVRSTGSHPPLSNKAIEELLVGTSVGAAADGPSKLPRAVTPRSASLAIPRTMTPRPFPAIQAPTATSSTGMTPALPGRSRAASPNPAGAMPAALARAGTGSVAMPPLPRSATGSASMPHHPASSSPDPIQAALAVDDLPIAPREPIPRGLTPPPDDDAPTVFEPLSSSIVQEAQRAERAELAELAQLAAVTWPVVDRETARQLVGDRAAASELLVEPAFSASPTLPFEHRHPVEPWLTNQRQKKLIVAAIAGAAVLLGIALAVGLTSSETDPARNAAVPGVVAHDAIIEAPADPKPVASIEDVAAVVAAETPETPEPLEPPAPKPATTAKPPTPKLRFSAAELTAAYGAGKYANVVASCAAGAVAIEASICVLAACRVSNQPRAKLWYASTPLKRRGSLLTTCMSLGVSLDGSQRTPRPAE